MSHSLEIDYAYRSEAGIKSNNQDCCNAMQPEGSLRLTKGIAIAIADGVSASEGGGEASQIAIHGFLSDYFSTPESWTVKTSAARVLQALNQWLCGQGQVLYDSPRGMLTTLSALVLKSTTAHLFHVGDSRIYRYSDGDLEQLTQDHRVWAAKDREFLSRALGADPHIDIDYKALSLDDDDLFLFTTDGVHDFLSTRDMLQLLKAGQCNLQDCANRLVEKALAAGSRDNASCQLVRVLSLSQDDEDDILRRINELPFPPSLAPGMKIDGYELLRELHASRRSEVFLALDTESGEKVVLKTPSENYRDDPEYMDGFLHEEWVGRRLANPHLLKALEPRRRRFIYHLTEYVEGRSLAQWIQDTGLTSLPQVRDFATQIIEGLRALHRAEIYHQDLKPDNVLMDSHGTLKLIDFGSSQIAGMVEISSNLNRNLPQGTLNYAAPECLRGEPCSKQSDLYSLGVMLYELLTGKLPYGEQDTPTPKHKWNYTSARGFNPQLPTWVDHCLAKAVHPDPRRRYDTLSEFLYDLRRPNKAWSTQGTIPLIERHPLQFWKGLSFVLFLLNLGLLYWLDG